LGPSIAPHPEEPIYESLNRHCSGGNRRLRGSIRHDHGFAVSNTHGGPAINPGGIVPVYSSATTTPVQLSIGGVPVTPLFSGIGSAGLYQLNVKIPSGPGTGDLPIVATAGGVQTQSLTLISIQ
jgi:hypothetical protein